MDLWREDDARRSRAARGSASYANLRHPSILLYSHDTYGLGHFRRNSAIAHALRRRDPSVRLVMLTGSPLAGRWRLPNTTELVRMPGAIKVGADEYRPVASVSMSSLRAERASIIASTLLGVRPDVFLVDHSPLGMKCELRLALELARAKLPETQVVLGLRDILDDPATVRRSWTEQGIYEALARSYDQILVYGCRELFDVTELYDLEPSVQRRTVFTGYIAKDPTSDSVLEARLGAARGPRLVGRRVLVTGGGGGDAAELFKAFLSAWPLIAKTSATEALLVTGPMMSESDREQILRMAAGLDGVELLPSSTSMLSLIAAADVVVSMGGYNSVVECLSARRPLVVVPRTAPRREQLIRARILERLGLARMVMLGPGAAAALAAAVAKSAREPGPSSDAWRLVDLGGGERVARLLVAKIRQEVQC